MHKPKQRGISLLIIKTEGWVWWHLSLGRQRQTDRSMFEDGLVFIIVPGPAGLHSEILSLQKSKTLGYFRRMTNSITWYIEYICKKVMIYKDWNHRSWKPVDWELWNKILTFVGREWHYIFEMIVMRISIKTIKGMLDLVKAWRWIEAGGKSRGVCSCKNRNLPQITTQRKHVTVEKVHDQSSH